MILRSPLVGLVPRLVSGQRARMLALILCLMPTPADAATIGGIVHDPDGRPAPGARVVVSGPLAPVHEAITDETGRFLVPSVDEGVYELRVFLEGFRADPVRLLVGSAGNHEVPIALRLSAVTESIVVSAAQVDLPLSLATDSVTIVTAEQLRTRQIETVADALRSVAGLSVMRNGGRGGLTSLFPRGGESDFTLVLVDGVRVNLFGGGFDFAHLPVADIERIEIVRGPQSALYGADAIGAVIHIVTRHGGPTRTEGTLEAGGFGTVRLVASSAGSKGRWSWGAAAERFLTDGFEGLAAATGERVSNDDYRRTHASASAGWRDGRGNTLRADLRLGTTDRGFPGPFGSNPAGLFGGVDRIARGTDDSRSAGLSLIHPWSRAVRQRMELSVFDLESDFTSPFGVSQSGTRRVDLRVQTDAAVSRALGFSVGADIQRERAHSTFITGSDAALTPVIRGVIGSFGEARLALADRLFVTGGLRIERIRRASLDADPLAFPPRPYLARETETSANPKLSVAFFLQPPSERRRQWTRVRAGAGTGIRPPDGFEIAFTDNPRLKPERSRSVDIGIEQALLGGALLVDATAFANQYDDLIVAIGRALQDVSRFRTDNVSNARARGLELSSTWRTRGRFEGHVTYTWLDTAIQAVDRVGHLAPPPFTVGDPLLRRPRHQGSIDLTYAAGRMTTFVRLSGRGRMLDIEPTFGAFGGLFSAPGYGVASAGTAIDIRPGVTVTVRVENLFDRAYEETLGFPALGRTAVVGVRLAHRR